MLQDRIPFTTDGSSTSSMTTSVIVVVVVVIVVLVDNIKVYAFSSLPGKQAPQLHYKHRLTPPAPMPRSSINCKVSSRRVQLLEFALYLQMTRGQE